MKKLNMEIDLLTVQAKFQVEEPGSMVHIIPIDGMFHDLSYTGLDFNSLELNRERKSGLDVIYLDTEKLVAVVMNSENKVAVADYTQYSNLPVVVKDDGSVILDRVLRQYNRIAAVRLIIQGLNTSFNVYNKDSLKEQLGFFDMLDQEDYINYCYTNYKLSENN